MHVWGAEMSGEDLAEDKEEGEIWVDAEMKVAWTMKSALTLGSECGGPPRPDLRTDSVGTVSTISFRWLKPDLTTMLGFLNGG